ncbi:MAG: stalk domain-containing protein [Ignavibacteriales bacterium]
MSKKNRIGLILLIALLCCLAIGLGSVGAASTATNNIGRSTNIDPSTILQPGTAITGDTLSQRVNLDLNLINPYPVIKYPQGGEVIMANQPVLIEYTLTKKPEIVNLTENCCTQANGWWIFNEVNQVLDGENDTFGMLAVFPKTYIKAMPNNTGQINVEAVWDNNDRSKDTNTVSKGFTFLGPNAKMWSTQINATPGNNKITLSWDPVLAAPGRVTYTLSRRTANSDFKPITDFELKETSYTDNTAKNSTQYEYQLEANMAGSGYHLYDNVIATPSSWPTGQLIFTVGSSIIKLNGVDKQIDSPPVIVNGRTFVPIRALVENIGGTISWDASKQQITINYKSMILVMQIGNTNATINGSPVEVDVPPYISDEGRVMIPLRFVSDNFGLNVLWDAANYKITINF